MKKARDKLIDKILSKIDKKFTGKVVVTYFLNQGGVRDHDITLQYKVKPVEE